MVLYCRSWRKSFCRGESCCVGSVKPSGLGSVLLPSLSCAGAFSLWRSTSCLLSVPSKGWQGALSPWWDSNDGVCRGCNERRGPLLQCVPPWGLYGSTGDVHPVQPRKTPATASSQPSPFHGQKERWRVSRKGPAKKGKRVRLFWRQEKNNRSFLPLRNDFALAQPLQNGNKKPC